MEVPQQQKSTFKVMNGRKPKGRRTAPKAEERQTGKKEPYAYTFKDASVGEMPVLNTANAWWVNPVKVQKLVDSYKFFATDDQACFYAGISIDQLMYFQKLHPDFYRIKHACKQDPNLRAKKKIVGELEKNAEIAKWWLENTEKDTFSRRVENTGANGRDLFDGMTEKFKQLTEAVRKDQEYDDDKEHAGDNDTEHADAGQDRNGDDSVSAEVIATA